MNKQRITMITLGVADLKKSSLFYEKLGWKAHPRSLEGIIFFPNDRVSSWTL